MNLSEIVRQHGTLLALAGVTLFLAAFAALYLKPEVAGDSPSYIEAMGVLTGIPISPDFVPNRILTTPAPLVLVLFLTPLVGILPAWLGMNIVFYLVMSVASFFLFRTIFESDRVAFLGALLVVGNYAPLTFGLNYLMDAGGWAFYSLALWGVARFVIRDSTSAILWAAAAVGAGALFKEYALLGCIAIALALLWYAMREPLKAFGLMVITTLLAIAPIALVHLDVYRSFGYTYLDWMRYNAETYVYASRVKELVKALSSLMNVLLPLAVLGAWIWGSMLVRTARNMFATRRNVVVAAVLLSALPALFWGGITQRVLFMLVPAAVAMACFVFERYERRWYAFLILVLFYVVINLHMEVLLQAINLPF